MIVERQLRALGKRGVEDAGIRLGDQQTRWVPAAVADDLAGGRVGRVFRVADRAQRGAVEQGAVIEMQQEDRRIGRDRVDLLDRRQALLLELMRGEAADHAHPLRWGRDRDLPLEHGHRVGEAAHTVPAQLHVEIEPAADDVQVVVDEAGQCATTFQIDDPRRSAGERHHVFIAPDCGEDAIRDRDRAGGRVRAIQRGKAAVPKNQVSTHVRTSPYLDQSAFRLS